MKPSRATITYLLSAIGTGLFFANAALAAGLPGYAHDEIANAVHIGIGTFLGYLGLGAAVPQIHPTIGNKTAAAP